MLARYIYSNMWKEFTTKVICKYVDAEFYSIGNLNHEKTVHKQLNGHFKLSQDCQKLMPESLEWPEHSGIPRTLQLMRLFRQHEYQPLYKSWCEHFNKMIAEKIPEVHLKYYLTEVQIVEYMDFKVKTVLRHNLTKDSTFSCNYSNSVEFQNFIIRVINQVVTSDVVKSRKGMPQCGKEYFFSNVMVKIVESELCFHREPVKIVE